MCGCVLGLHSSSLKGGVHGAVGGGCLGGFGQAGGGEGGDGGGDDAAGSRKATKVRSRPESSEPWVARNAEAGRMMAPSAGDEEVISGVEVREVLELEA